MAAAVVAAVAAAQGAVAETHRSCGCGYPFRVRSQSSIPLPAASPLAMRPAAAQTKILTKPYTGKGKPIPAPLQGWQTTGKEKPIPAPPQGWQTLRREATQDWGDGPEATSYLG